MKRTALMVFALMLAVALCACVNSNSAVPNATTPQSSIQPTETPAATSSQAPAAQDQQGDVFDETTPEGADVLRQGVFFYQNVEMSSDYGDGLSPREGALLADDLLGDIGLYSGNGIPAGQCVYIFLTEISALDSAMGRECYIYSVCLGPAEGGIMGGDDFQMLYSVSVDYSGNKTAAIYGSDPSSDPEQTSTAESVQVNVDAAGTGWINVRNMLSIPPDWTYDDTGTDIEVSGFGDAEDLTLIAGWWNPGYYEWLEEDNLSQQDFLFDDGNLGDLFEMNGSYVWINGDMYLVFGNSDLPGGYYYIYSDNIEIITSIARSLTDPNK